jgi:hypothetical protein
MLFISAISSEVVTLFLSIRVKQNVDFHLAMFTVALTAFWRGVRCMKAT